MNHRWVYQQRKAAISLLTMCVILGVTRTAIGQQSPMMTVETQLSAGSIEGKYFPIAVQADTDSDVNIRLKVVLEDRLRLRGFTIADEATMILQFGTESTGSKFQKSNLQLRGSAGSAGGREGSLQYSLPLGKSKPPQKRVLYRVTTRLADQRDRELWRGSAKADFASRRDRFTVLSMLVRQMADLVGKGDVSRSRALSEIE